MALIISAAILSKRSAPRAAQSPTLSPTLRSNKKQDQIENNMIPMDACVQKKKYRQKHKKAQVKEIINIKQFFSLS